MGSLSLSFKKVPFETRPGKAKRTTIDGLLLLKVSPKDEGWVLPGLGGVDLVGPVVLRDRDLHELEHKELN